MGVKELKVSVLCLFLRVSIEKICAVTGSLSTFGSKTENWQIVRGNLSKF